MDGRKRGSSRSTVSVVLRATRPEEIDLVLEMEAAASAAPFIIRWLSAQHHEALADPDQDHLAIEEDGRLAGLVLLAGLRDRNQAVELRRIVVREPGRGLGSRALQLIIKHASSGSAHTGCGWTSSSATIAHGGHMNVRASNMKESCATLCLPTAPTSR